MKPKEITLNKLTIYTFLSVSLWLQGLHCKQDPREDDSYSSFSRDLEFHSQKKEFYSLKRDYHSLKEDYYDLKGEYQDLKTEFCQIKKELDRLKKELEEMKEDLYAEEDFSEEESDSQDYLVQEDQKKESSKRPLMKNYDDRFCYFEFLPGYFYPTDKRLREIYDNGGFNGQAELGVFALDWLGVWVRGGAFWKDAKTKVLQDSTKITIGNISAGVKFFVPIVNQVQFYLGAGPRVFFLRVKNGSTFVEQKVTKTQVGAAVLGGFWLFPVKDVPFFFDLFVDYSFSRMKFSSNQSSERNNLDLDGPTVGMGVGYQF